MKKIALIRNSYSYDLGGAEIFPVNLAKILKTKGYEPVLMSSNRGALAMAERSGISTKRSPWLHFQNYSGPGVLLFPIYCIWQLLLTIWYAIYFIKNKISVVHPQSRDDFISATLAAKILNKEVVWSDHADLKHVYSNHKIWYKNPVGKLVYAVSKYANHIIVESLSEKSLIEKSLGFYLPENYSVVYLGVVDSSNSIPKNKNSLVLVSTSRLVKDKGIGELISAVKLTGAVGLTLKICGDGPDADFFKDMAKNIDYVKFMGHVDDIDAVLREADILIHPTYHEGFGLSLVEAEMHSLPIIATNTGSIPEIVEDKVSGLLVPVKDVDALAKAIKVLAADSELRNKMGKAGRNIYLKKFQFDKIVTDRIIPMYEGKT